MRLLPLLALTLALACTTTAAIDDPDPDTEIGETDDVETDTEEECALEGEACVVYEEGGSSCCNGRHTCYDVGCYYVRP